MMKNKHYEEKLHNEIIVDCYGEYEQNMGWLNYAEDELEFPFEATITIRKQKGGTIQKKVKVLDLSSDDFDADRNFDLKVDIVLDDYIIDIPLSKLKQVKANENTIETIAIWKYWISR